MNTLEKRNEATTAATVIEYVRTLQPHVKRFERMNDPIIITDDQGHVMFMNRAMENISGFTAQEVVGHKTKNFWSGHMSQDFYKKLWHTVRDEGHTFIGEVVNDYKNGNVCRHEIHIMPFFNKDGQAKFFIGLEPVIHTGSNS